MPEYIQFPQAVHMPQKVLLTQELAKVIPVRSRDDDSMIHCKFFAPSSNWTWYVIDCAVPNEDGTRDEPLSRHLDRLSDPNFDAMFFGLVIGFEPELESFTLQQLYENALHDFGHHPTMRESLRFAPIERDLHFRPRRLSEVMK